LRHLNAARIVVAAPLKTLVDQLRARLTPFLPDHASIVVDSDGTTDIERLRLFIATTERSIVFTTYDSAVGVVCNLETTDDDVLVIDEAHNAYGNAALTRWAQQFKRGLLLTATPQHDLDEMFGCEPGYNLSFREAINQRLLCDYAVWFPLARDLAGEHVLEISIADLPHELALKAMFLLRGMLHTGARRTFAYLSSQDEAREFARVFVQVAEKYHGVPTWTGVIVSDTTHAQRAALFSSFRNTDNNGVFCVLASVRILDEGIDEPSCDSTFFSTLSDHASELRVVQRLMRGSRLDPARPCKTNHAFVWAASDECHHALELLKLADHTFSSHVRVLGASYDEQLSPSTQLIVTAQQSVLRECIDVSCVSAEQMWYNRLAQWRAFVLDHDRLPSKTKDADATEKRLGGWQYNMRNLYCDKPDDYRHIALSAEPRWMWRDDKRKTFEQSLIQWRAFVLHHDRLPSQQGKAANAAEKRLRKWQDNMRQLHDKPADSRNVALSAEPRWVWRDDKRSKRQSFEEWLLKWRAFVLHHDRLPSHSKDADAAEKRLGQWQDQMRNLLRDKTADTRHIVLSAEPRWMWVVGPTRKRKR
jgi:hypothetical protein